MSEVNESLSSPSPSEKVEGVTWRKAAKRWVASYYDVDGKRMTKLFKEFEDAKSYRLSALHEGLARTQSQASKKSDVKGVTWDKRNEVWRAVWTERGVYKKKSFRPFLLGGDEKAKFAAIQYMKEVERLKREEEGEKEETVPEKKEEKEKEKKQSLKNKKKSEKGRKRKKRKLDEDNEEKEKREVEKENEHPSKRISCEVQK